MKIYINDLIINSQINFQHKTTTSPKPKPTTGIPDCDDVQYTKTKPTSPPGGFINDYACYPQTQSANWVTNLFEHNPCPPNTGKCKFQN